MNGLTFDREEFTEGERQLFLSDFKRMANEYFECENDADINVTRTGEGFSVCIIFGARRIKKFRSL